MYGLLKLLEGNVVNDENSDKIGHDGSRFSKKQVSGAFFTSLRACRTSKLARSANPSYKYYYLLEES